MALPPRKPEKNQQQHKPLSSAFERMNLGATKCGPQVSDATDSERSEEDEYHRNDDQWPASRAQEVTYSGPPSAPVVSHAANSAMIEMWRCKSCLKVNKPPDHFVRASGCNYCECNPRRLQTAMDEVRTQIQAIDSGEEMNPAERIQLEYDCKKAEQETARLGRKSAKSGDKISDLKVVKKRLKQERRRWRESQSELDAKYQELLKERKRLEKWHTAINERHIAYRKKQIREESEHIAIQKEYSDAKRELE
eukprot:363191_1